MRRSIYDFVPAPIRRWQLNDNLPSTVVREVMAGENGMASHNTSDMSTAGVGDTALAFNGVNRKISFGENPLPSSSDWTIVARVFCAGEADGNGDTNATAFEAAEYVGIFPDEELKGFSVYRKTWDGAGAYDKIVAQVGDGNGTRFVDLISDITTVAKNEWFDLCLTYDSITGRVGPYVNATYKGNLIKPYAKANNNFSIGNSIDWVGNGWWNGRIQNVMIFDKKLTVKQIIKLYDIRRGRESAYGPRPNRIYNTNINSSIFGD